MIPLEVGAAFAVLLGVLVVAFYLPVLPLAAATRLYRHVLAPRRGGGPQGGAWRLVWRLWWWYGYNAGLYRANWWWKAHVQRVPGPILRSASYGVLWEQRPGSLLDDRDRLAMRAARRRIVNGYNSVTAGWGYSPCVYRFYDQEVDG